MAVKGYDILIDDINKMLNSERAGLAATNSVFVAQKKRIFQDGKAVNGTEIGQYSTKPISVSKKNQPRNTGKTRFSGGYREYKSMIGQGTKVNLRLTDQMMMDLGTTVIGPKEWGIGFNNEFNAKKSGWNEEHFKKDIFATSDEEDDIWEKVFEFELNKI